MKEKHRWGIGIVGAGGWGGSAHIPALAALEDFEVRAVTGTRLASAKKVAQAYGIASYYDDAAKMAGDPDVDIVVVTVRVPEHKNMILAALGAGKHVFSEWPLARNTQEAAELAAAADKRDLVHITGLQARANPVIGRLQTIIGEAAIGRVLAVNALASLPDFPTARGTVDLTHTYLLDKTCGADQLTIGAAHMLDAIEYMVAPFDEVSARLETQFPEVRVQESGQTIRASAPDQVLIAGRLTQGASVSVQVVNGGSAGFSLHIIGTEGEIVITPKDGLMFQMDRLCVRIFYSSGKSETLSLPETPLPGGKVQPGVAYHVARLYALLAQRLARA